MWSIGDNREKTCNGITRRGFLQVGFSSALGLSLPEILYARDLKKKQKTGQKKHSVMLIWLWGGPSHIDTFDMKPNAPLEYRGVPFALSEPMCPVFRSANIFPSLQSRQISTRFSAPFIMERMTMGLQEPLRLQVKR